MPVALPHTTRTDAAGDGSSSPPLVVARPQGLYCPPGDFYIDPWRRVDRAVITHAHADHARPGCEHYLACGEGSAALRLRLGEIRLQTLDYGETIDHHGVRLSLHPAGHVLGSAQVRLEWRGQVWVVSGDYKPEPVHDHNPTCTPYEPVRCHCFVTECTFGLPVYRWRRPGELMAEINAWWQTNADAGLTSVLYGYSLGKAQRVLAGLDAGIGPILVHPAIEPMNQAYRVSGVALPATRPLPVELRVSPASARRRGGAGTTGASTPDDPARVPPRSFVIAPPAAARAAWLGQLGEVSDAMASGRMHLRGNRRRQSLDRGFALSDHADWPGLVAAIAATGAERVIVTHGQSAVLVRWLQQQGLQAGVFETAYGDSEESAES